MAAKSFKKLREDVSSLHKSSLPTYPSDASSEVPDSLTKSAKLGEDAKSDLPTHASDASSEVPDSLGGIGKRPVKASQDGQAIANASAKHGNAQASELPEEEEKDEDEEKKLSEAEDKELEDELEDMEEEVETELKKDDEEKEVKESDDSDEDDKEMKESDDSDEDDKEVKESDEEEKKEDEDLKEHLAALTSGTALSEDTKKKVKTIFETAVTASVEKKLVRERKKISEAYKTVSKRKVKKLHERLVDRLENYFDYIVEQFLKDNEVAIETGLRAEIAEEFMLGLKGLLAEHFVEVPEAKKDLVKELSDKSASLEKELNAEINKNVELKKKLNENDQDSLVRAKTEGLSELDAEKFRALIKSVNFDSKEAYSEKLEIIKESYFNKTSKPVVDATSTIVEDGGIAKPRAEGATDAMDVYADAISRSLQR